MMHNVKKSALLFLGIFLVVTFFSGMASAQGRFPTKPVTIVVHAGAGGGSDIFARTLAAGFEKDKILPQPIIVENRAGGSGAIAFAYVAGKKKDPHFMVTAVTSFMTTPLLGLTPVGIKDFTPIANLAFDEYMLMVRTNSRFRTLQDIVTEAKANPKKITIGGTQLGSSDSICTYLLEKEAGIRLNYIVFNSGGEVNAALLGGHVDLAITNPGEALELFKAGRVRILGVYSEKRLPGAPDIPTMKEQGVNAVYVQNRGLVAPADISVEARKTLEEALLRYTRSETFQKYLRDNMLSEAYMDHAAFSKFLEEWNVRFAAILTDMGLLRKK
jgi:putative tricarboxylic transport membrane protein